MQLHSLQLLDSWVNLVPFMLHTLSIAKWGIYVSFSQIVLHIGHWHWGNYTDVDFLPTTCFFLVTVCVLRHQVGTNLQQP